MSDSRDIELIKDPGLPEHVHRSTDIDPKAAKRAERQIAILFALSCIGTLLLIYSYIFISDETFIFIPVLGEPTIACFPAFSCKAMTMMLRSTASKTCSKAS